MKSVCIITFFHGYKDNALVRIDDLISIFNEIASNLFVISNTKKDYMNERKITYKEIDTTLNSKWFIIKILKVFKIQVKTCQHILKNRKQFNCTYWGIGTSHLLLPVMLTKLLRKKIYLFIGGKASTEVNSIYDKGLISHILPILYKKIEKKVYDLSDKIIINSNHWLNEPDVALNSHKVFSNVICNRIIDVDIFRYKESINDRGNVIGFIGRFSKEKGVMEFIDSIINIKSLNMKVVIIGDGPLRNELLNKINKYGLEKKVEIIDWVAHKKLPYYFNKIKFLVVPSYTEGLPTVVLEAMACGVPVLATPVGAIPNLIDDELNGFIIKNNKPVNIANTIVRAINYPYLEKLAINAHNYITKNYTFEATVQKYKEVFNN